MSQAAHRASGARTRSSGRALVSTATATTWCPCSGTVPASSSYRRSGPPAGDASGPTWTAVLPTGAMPTGEAVPLSRAGRSRRGRAIAPPRQGSSPPPSRRGAGRISGTGCVARGCPPSGGALVQGRRVSAQDAPLFVAWERTCPTHAGPFHPARPLRPASLQRDAMGIPALPTCTPAGHRPGASSMAPTGSRRGPRGRDQDDDGRLAACRNRIGTLTRADRGGSYPRSTVASGRGGKCTVARPTGSGASLFRTRWSWRRPDASPKPPRHGRTAMSHAIGPMPQCP